MFFKKKKKKLEQTERTKIFREINGVQIFLEDSRMYIEQELNMINQDFYKAKGGKKIGIDPWESYEDIISLAEIILKTALSNFELAIDDLEKAKNILE